ncbi:hypothetical protein PPL_11589 [Heterostelium album PN500]|uniref:Uncharacterized protein n=1 Tax=Heterostelium pallidum (strain ATCC 26659 / Pp 5 / PN500) TaxID=670386 RepID=D3BVJ8_HETP5|nr:hypothetical protein PPL_11589 [Heterostelium album PN500]EFA74621.1 hypothetical protein PPL_11589 [Heterostelium album PN500]|eukprot:XP_020426755.1 hypothetical protein PPL_11589 [Heterostelium album PN500]
MRNIVIFRSVWRWIAMAIPKTKIENKNRIIEALPIFCTLMALSPAHITSLTSSRKSRYLTSESVSS